MGLELEESNPLLGAYLRLDLESEQLVLGQVDPHQRIILFKPKFLL